MFQKSLNLPLVLVIGGSLILASTVGFAIYNFNSSSSQSKIASQVAGIPDSNSSSSQSSQSKPPKPGKLNLKMMFLGNTFWGRYIDDWAKASPLKEKYPFSGLSTLEKYKYDAWISGLECPITSTYRSSKLQDSDLKFSCLPDYLPEAAKWLEVFSLANNHTDNMEEVDGFAQTKKYLTENKIGYFGHFDNSKTEELCKVINLEIKDKSAETNFRNNPNIGVENPQNSDSNNSNSVEKYFVPIAFCGYHNVFAIPTDSELSKISEYSKYWPTIVMPHGGAEYVSKPDQIKTKIYRQMIELGADAVMGDHPHSVQSTEVWQDKLIVYSLGNFMFDQQNSQSLRQSLAVEAEFELEFDNDLEKLMEVSEKCTNQNEMETQTETQTRTQIDSQNTGTSEKKSENSTQKTTNSQNPKTTNTSENCLKMAKEQNLKKPKFKIKYDATATDSTGKLTQKAGSQVIKNVLNIANWTTTKSLLDKIYQKPNLEVKETQTT